MLDPNNTMTDNGAEVKAQGGAEVFSGISVANYSCMIYGVLLSIGHYTVLISFSKMNV